jgi:hypothetical protein
MFRSVSTILSVHFTRSLFQVNPVVGHSAFDRYPHVPKGALTVDASDDSFAKRGIMRREPHASDEEHSRVVKVESATAKSAGRSSSTGKAHTKKAKSRKKMPAVAAIEVQSHGTGKWHQKRENWNMPLALPTMSAKTDPQDEELQKAQDAAEKAEGDPLPGQEPILGSMNFTVEDANAFANSCEDIVTDILAGESNVSAAGVKLTFHPAAANKKVDIVFEITGHARKHLKEIKDDAAATLQNKLQEQLESDESSPCAQNVSISGFNYDPGSEHEEDGVAADGDLFTDEERFAAVKEDGPDTDPAQLSYHEPPFEKQDEIKGTVNFLVHSHPEAFEDGAAVKDEFCKKFCTTAGVNPPDMFKGLAVLCDYSEVDFDECVVPGHSAALLEAGAARWITTHARRNASEEERNSSHCWEMAYTVDIGESQTDWVIGNLTTFSFHLYVEQFTQTLYDEGFVPPEVEIVRMRVGSLERDMSAPPLPMKVDPGCTENCSFGALMNESKKFENFTSKGFTDVQIEVMKTSNRMRQRI